MTAIRVLLADDSYIVRAGLRHAVEALPGFAVVGEAASGRQTIELAKAVRPDIVLMDLRMTDGDGIATTRVLSTTMPAIRTLVVSWSDDATDLQGALLAGAKGYLVHGRFDPEELASAMQALASDDVSIMPVIPAGIVVESDEGARTGSAAALTKRELEILSLVRRGRRNREIAREVGIEEKTVKNHINNIYSKLGIASRVEAMAVHIEQRRRASLRPGPVGLRAHPDSERGRRMGGHEWKTKT